MKIERISDNQIRCTLSRDDLASRHIQLGELAYGSAKARQLFHELIQAAAAEVGFQVENMPVMVEAIPMSTDSIVLIVTRVDDPDELDTRFSRFSPNIEEEWEEPDFLDDLMDGLLDGADLVKDLLKESAIPADLPPSQEPAPVPSTAPSVRLFAFDNLDDASRAAAAIPGVILVHSTLYKDPAMGQYFLCVRCGEQEDAFRRICNTLSEYGTLKHSSPGILAHCEEHCEVIIATRALDRLARLA